MKIIDLKTRCVAIPLNAQLRHNTGVHPGYFLRTVLEGNPGSPRQPARESQMISLDSAPCVLATSLGSREFGGRGNINRDSFQTDGVRLDRRSIGR